MPSCVSRSNSLNRGNGSYYYVRYRLIESPTRWWAHEGSLFSRTKAPTHTVSRDALVQAGVAPARRRACFSWFRLNPSPSQSPVANR
jgi:hypothetical protein